MAVAPDAQASSLREFVTGDVAGGAVVISDALSRYPNAVTGPDYEHDPINIKASGLPAHEVLPWVHRDFNLLKTWLEGTHQGRIEPTHIQSYFDEFVFRFNRRHARQRGLLFLRLLERAVTAPPLRYADIVVNHTPKRRPPVPPGQRRWPGTLAVGPLDRPWRSVE